MKTVKYILKTIGVLSLAISFSIGPLVPSALAKISIPSPSSVASQLENRYHINLQSIQDQSESFNVANQKQSVPEVALFFAPSDPKAGAKITASALPSFFANEKSDLYFTWYLKRKGCDVRGSDVSRCDNDGNGVITVNDWKIEAMRALAQNGYDNADADYTSDTDEDGYNARMGGDNKVGVADDYCAIYAPSSGTIYELGTTPETGLICPKNSAGKQLSPVCIINQTEVTSGSTSGSSSSSFSSSYDTGTGIGSSSGSLSSSTSGSTFSESSGTTYNVSGYPYCSGGVSTCAGGATLRCALDTDALGLNFLSSATSAPNSPLPACSTNVSSSFTKVCDHLFPNARIGGVKSGDGTFGAGEERFWQTDPKDPSTADNGNKDEANIVGLGQDTFTWNYDSGDEVGVAVEGTSMITTKHSDSSSYVMWAFPKNQCRPTGAMKKSEGAYTQSIKGYDVNFQVVDIEFDECFENNLVDPTEGGQPGKMEVSVSATPENPVNDETGDMAGDIVTAFANVSNSTAGSSGQVFDWKVSIANNIQFDNTGDRNSKDITAELKSAKLLNMTKGNGLSQISLPMNLSPALLAGHMNATGVGYIRFSVDVAENFASNTARKGRGDVILKFQNIKDRISAYLVTANKESLKLSFNSSDSRQEICNDNLFRRAVCPVVKNEIIGLRVGTPGFTSYEWTVNGSPLLCSSRLSSQCPDGTSGNATFLPIFGEVGDTFTVSVTALDVVSGKSATLSRVFRIVEPVVEIVSADKNETWPKFLGQYKDTEGNLYSDLSRTIFQTFSTGKLRVKAEFSPSFLAASAQGKWTIDGQEVAENADGEIDAPVTKSLGGVYNLSFNASVIQSPEIRRALQAYWNISTFNSGEEYFSESIQVEVLENEGGALASENGSGLKSFAAIASFIPASVLFTVKAFFSMALILLVSGFMMAIIPESSLRRVRG